MQNTNAILRSAKSHTVRVVSPNVYEVTSGVSSRRYSVTTHPGGGTCTCKWGTAGGCGQQEKSDCSHVVAVAMFQESKKKYVYLYVIQQDAGQGWEDVATHDKANPRAWKNAQQDLRDYWKNQPEYPVHCIERREINE